MICKIAHYVDVVYNVALAGIWMLEDVEIDLRKCTMLVAQTMRRVLFHLKSKIEQGIITDY